MKILLSEKTSHLSAGTFTPPSSKSHSIRALFLALLAKGQSKLINLLEAEDTRDALAALSVLGLKGGPIFEGNGIPLPVTSSVYSGSSGITTHFVLPLLGLRENPSKPVRLDCSEQMQARPIQPLLNSLENLGLHFTFLGQEGACPVLVSGPLSGGKTDVSGITSQYLSSLLMALPCAPQDSELQVADLRERPYVEMTLSWLKRQSIAYEHHSDGRWDIYRIAGGQRYRPFEAQIPGDFSSASYLIAAAALLPGSIQLTGLDMSDPQADKALIPLLQAMGAQIEVTAEGLQIEGGVPLKGMEIDLTDIPDLLPTLAVIGTQVEGGLTLRSVSHARLKETDRVYSMLKGLSQLGARLEEGKETLVIRQSRLTGDRVKGYGDHRTVMALALAGLLAEGSTQIEEPEAIRKTFPHFVELMQSMGAKLFYQTVS